MNILLIRINLINMHFIQSEFCSLVLTYPEGISMLRQDGIEIGDEDDLRLDHMNLNGHFYLKSMIIVSNSTVNEKRLGKLVREKVPSV